jgi:transcriptional regulator with XRE-family HTH domain
MLSPSEQAHLNLDQARDMRADGISYREIARALGLTSSQLSHIRRALKRAKASQTKLRRADPAATDRDLLLSQSVLPPGLRQTLKASGLITLGDVAARIADPELPGLEALPGVGPHRAQLVKGLLDHHGLLPGPEDLRSAVKALFPEFGDAGPA